MDDSEPKEAGEDQLDDEDLKDVAAGMQYEQSLTQRDSILFKEEG